MWITFTFLLLLLLYSLLIVYYRWGWITLPEFFIKERSMETYQTTVSVIVPARNEEHNISNCIESLLQQTYPPHLVEIIIVDDHSTDDTNFIVQKFLSNYSRIKLITLTEQDQFNAYKKKALSRGIEISKGSIIITTDADCTHNPFWIETIAQYQQEKNAAFIAAPVSYTIKKNILSIFQALDFLSLQGITGASVHKRFHTMCNGANLAYTREAFEEVNGFAGIDNIPTGDDMLLMHKIFLKYPKKVFYLKSSTAITYTSPSHTWSEFFHQRIRWASKSTHYNDKRITGALFIVYFFNVSFLILLFLSFFSWHFFTLFIVTISIKTIIEWWFLNPVAIFFKLKKWLTWFPFLQPMHILYTIVVGWLGKFGNYKWKDRKI